VVILALNLVA